jgi:hypothetical protein
VMLAVGEQFLDMVRVDATAIVPAFVEASQ